MSFSNDFQKRAEAAEKTVSILKSKVIELYNGGGQTAIHKQLEKAKQREEENRRKRELMELRNAELKNYSETLEHEVARRTEEMKTILNNVTFGFLVVDRKMRVGKEYTRSCSTLFGTKNIASQDLLTLLGISQREREHFQLTVDQVFEDLMPEDVSLAQMPQRFPLNGKILRLEAKAIRGAENMIEGLLFSISDISNLEAAQKEAAINRVLLGILKQKNSFINFLTEVRVQLNTAEATLPDQVKVRRIVHTMNGNASAYGLSDISHAIHRIEDEDQIETAQIRRIESTFREFLQQHHDVLGLDFDLLEKDRVGISNNELRGLESISQSLPEKEGRELRVWKARISQKPVGIFLGPMDEFVSGLAQRLGKKVDFIMRGMETLVDGDTVKGTLQGLIHLIRNAVDHGTESPELRGDKCARGLLELSVGSRDGNYVIEIKDDGRGIDTDKLTKKAVARGLITPTTAAALKHEDKVQLIFLDGLSSADETTEISGRGVGMSAVLSEVRHVGGRFVIKSEFGKGTTMTIYIPEPEVLRVGKQKAA